MYCVLVFFQVLVAVSYVFAIHNLLCKAALIFVCSLLTTVTYSLHVFCKALFTPVPLAAMSLFLKRFIFVWMHLSPGVVEDGCALSSHGN